MKHHINHENKIKPCFAENEKDCPLFGCKHFQDDDELMAYLAKEYFTKEDDPIFFCPTCGETVRTQRDLFIMHGSYEASLCCKFCVQHYEVGKCIDCQKYYHEGSGRFGNYEDFICNDCRGITYDICYECQNITSEPMKYGPKGTSMENELLCPLCHEQSFAVHHDYD